MISVVRMNECEVPTQVANIRATTLSVSGSVAKIGLKLSDTIIAIRTARSTSVSE